MAQCRVVYKPDGTVAVIHYAPKSALSYEDAMARSMGPFVGMDYDDIDTMDPADMPAATAKKDLRPGESLDGEGGYTVFGKLVRAEDSLKNGFLPLGLTGGAKMTRPVAKGRSLTYADVELDRSTLAYQLRKEVETVKS